MIYSVGGILKETLLLPAPLVGLSTMFQGWARDVAPAIADTEASLECFPARLGVKQEVRASADRIHMEELIIVAGITTMIVAR